MNLKQARELNKKGWIATIPIQFPTYGFMVKFLREGKKMTQAQLAKKLKTKQSAIARIENSEIPPSMRMMLKISKVFGLAMEAPKMICKKCGKELNLCKCKK